MFLGVRSAKRGDKAAAFRWTIITAICGIIFAGLHLREWFGLIDEGVRLFKNPWGNDLFGASFFAITGLHLTHVTVGIVVLLVIATRYKRGRSDADDLEITGLYWHFVDLVWRFVVPLIYLLNVAK
jgi:cytochrome c oxidase subunit 3